MPMTASDLKDNHALAIGKIVMAWNEYHEIFGEIFADLFTKSHQQTSLAIAGRNSVPPRVEGGLYRRGRRSQAASGRIRLFQTISSSFPPVTGGRPNAGHPSHSLTGPEMAEEATPKTSEFATAK
jgi:hypothetical protein